MSSGSAKHVVVVGGSFAGTAFIRALETAVAPASVRVTLIDRRDGWFFNLAVPRAVSQPTAISGTVLPFTRLYKHAHRIVRASVTEVHAHRVVLDTGDTIEFDYLVIATGSDYAGPPKLSGLTSLADITSQLAVVADAVKDAPRVLIVGGGPVGIELAGDIATEYPEKRVTLVHAQARFFADNAFPKAMADALEKNLVKLGVDIVYSDRLDVSAEDRAAGYHVGKRTDTTVNGRVVESDLQIFAVGAARPNTALLHTLGHDVVDADSGRVIVSPTLQLPSHPHIFAIGDVSAADKASLAFIAQLQAKLAAANLVALLQGKHNKLKPWKTLHGMFVTTGRRGGAGIFPYGGMQMGNFMVRTLKAKDMMLGTFAKNAVRPEPVQA
jgi:NADH dehydrogenase FAD-containing subunit